MAYARPFGQAQSAASPWSAGVPPGLQQQHPQQQAQQMFNQPMGAFDLSGAWQGQQQAGQWAPQPMQPMQPTVQFVQNPNAFMQQQQQPPPQQQRYHNQQHNQQRPMHQRSLSAPRTGVNGPNKRFNQNSSFGSSGGGNGGGGQWQQRQNNNNNSNNSNNNNNNNAHQQRTARQQSRQKVQFNNNTTTSNGNNANTNNNRQQNQQKQQGQQQQQQQGQQQQQQSKKGVVKVTKVVKKQALRAKLGEAKAKSADSPSTNDKAKDGVDATTKAATATAAVAATTDKGVESEKSSSDRQVSKPQSKTAERKQFKLQARRNADALKNKKLPIAKSSGESAIAAAADGPGSEMKVDDGSPIDQAQLKCVPAVFGFVCKCCDVFLRDRFARREHIDSDEHMQKFKPYEQEQQRLKEESSKDAEEQANNNNLTAESSEAEKKSTQEEDQESSQVEEPKLSQDEEPKPEVSSNENVGERTAENS